MGPWGHMQWPLIEMAPDGQPCGDLWKLRSVRPAPRRHQRRIGGVLAASGRNAGIAPRHCRNPCGYLRLLHGAWDLLRRATGSDGA